MYWSVRCSLVAFLDLIPLWTSAPGAMNQFTAISTSVTGQMINPVPSLTNLGHYFTCIFFLQQLYSNFSLDAGQLWPMYFLDVTSTASFFTRGRADRQDTAQTQWFLLELATDHCMAILRSRKQLLTLRSQIWAVWTWCFHVNYLFLV